MNASRKPPIPTNTILWSDQHRAPVFVDDVVNTLAEPDVWTVKYYVRKLFLQKPLEWAKLRKMTVWEFFWYTDPKTGAGKIGWNERWKFWALLAAVLCLEYSLNLGGYADPGWKMFMQVFIPSMPMLFLLWTYAQWRNWVR